SSPKTSRWSAPASDWPPSASSTSISKTSKPAELFRVFEHLVDHAQVLLRDPLVNARLLRPLAQAGGIEDHDATGRHQQLQIADRGSPLNRAANLQEVTTRGAIEDVGPTLPKRLRTGLA